MKAQLLALAALVMMFGSVSHAGETRRVCLDSKGGVYTAHTDGYVFAENSKATLKTGSNLSELLEDGPMSTLKGEGAKMANTLSLDLQHLVAGVEGTPSNEPVLFSSPKLSLLCSSTMTVEEYEGANLSERSNR